jgi:hypothetical protein
VIDFLKIPIHCQFDKQEAGQVTWEKWFRPLDLQDCRFGSVVQYDGRLRSKENGMTLKEGSIPNEVHAKGAHANGKMKRKTYEKKLQKLQVELCRLQDWVKETDKRIIILFEGRDAAGKGGTRAEREMGLSPPVRGLLLLTLRHARLAPFPGR